MRLRSIPPANRTNSAITVSLRLASLSSMRAADRAGMVFVGRHELHQAQSCESRAHIIQPNAQAQRERQAFQQAWGARIRQIKELLADAATLAEAAFWQQELDRKE